ncbi:hypothetical protein [Paenibacillus thalictri]|uniref:Uncharacterized protein n=1 Tax=Paenibacillus thalictri TaxID=2527873 RepID=A0A4Q9DXB1_9BACL|nr:hypothetical protein [Paenibacillus thalictri]TBL80690.1 hypothetical protein EYB31_05540 [Paenibacillus thalictri]
MTPTKHINLRNKDGLVYCCLRNKVVQLDDQQERQFCSQCKMYAGPADGQGVECIWEDMRDIGSPYTAVDPYEEFKQNQKRKITTPPFISGLIVYGT